MQYIMKLDKRRKHACISFSEQDLNIDKHKHWAKHEKSIYMPNAHNALSSYNIIALL